MKPAEALSLRACRPRANPLIKSTNPLLNPRGEGFMPPPYPPPRLRLAQLLAVLPGEVARQTVIKLMKMNIFALGRSWGALGCSWAALGRSWADLGCSWATLGRSWPLLGRSWGALGRSWGDLGALLAALGAILGRQKRSQIAIFSKKK